VVRIMFLAAGKGMRLKPFTDERPKWMLDVFGQAILQHGVNVAHDCNVTDVVVIRGLSNNIVMTPSVAYINVGATSNMLETLFAASAQFSDDLVISYCDIVYEPRVLRALLDSPHAISVAIDRNWASYYQARAGDPRSIGESCEFENGLLRNIGQPLDGKALPSGQYIGLIRVRGSGVRAFKTMYADLCEKFRGKPWRNSADFSCAFMTDFLQETIDRGYPVGAIECSGGWLEFDTVGDYELLTNWKASGSLRQFIDPDSLPRFPAVCSAGGVVGRFSDAAGIEFLLVGTGDDGEWRIPKGMQDAGEAVKETAIREVHEETGVLAEPITYLGRLQWDYEYGGRRWDERAHFFAMKAFGSSPPRPDSEHAVAAWVPAEHALNGMKYENEQGILEKATASVDWRSMVVS